MANGVNKVVIIGNLGRDPEIKYINYCLECQSFECVERIKYNGRVA